MKKRTKNLYQVCCYLSQKDADMLNLLREIMPQLTNQDIFHNGVVDFLRYNIYSIDKKNLYLLREIISQLTNQDVFHRGVVELRYLVSVLGSFERTDKNGK